MAAFALIRFVATTRMSLTVGVCCGVGPAVTYLHALNSGVVSFQEAVANARTRVALEKQLASILENFPADATYLMHLGEHPGALQRADIPLSHVINEGNHRPWMKPNDPDGLWEKALAHPASYADSVIATGSDDVAKNANQEELQALIVLHVTGQPAATIYKTQKSNQPR